MKILKVNNGEIDDMYKNKGYIEINFVERVKMKTNV